MMSPQQCGDAACICARRGHLARALRVADVREELLATLAALADFAYGWGAA